MEVFRLSCSSCMVLLNESSSSRVKPGLHHKQKHSSDMQSYTPSPSVTPSFTPSSSETPSFTPSSRYSSTPSFSPSPSTPSDTNTAHVSTTMSQTSVTDGDAVADILCVAERERDNVEVGDRDGLNDPVHDGHGHDVLDDVGYPDPSQGCEN